MKRPKGRQNSDTCFSGKMPTAAESARLFAAYFKNRSIANRNKIVEAYLPQAEAIAKMVCKKLPSYLDYEDLLSSAYTGLIRSVELFDSKYKVNFTTFSTYKIRGQIFDDLREYNSKFPRLVMDRLKRIARAESLLFTQLEREPTPQEVADAVGLPLKKCNEVRAIGMPEYAILDNREDGEGVRAVTANDLADKRASDPFETASNHELATLAISNLPSPINLYVFHYFYAHRNLNEVGAIFGRSDSRMSQLVTYAIKRMRITLDHASLRGAA